MELRNRKVLVTGAGGFIGSHLVERLLNDGCQVRAMVHYNSRGDWGNLDLLPKELKGRLEVVAGDVADPFSVKSAVMGCEVVFHLAALIAIPYSYIAPQSYVTSNVLGTLNVLQACRECGVEKVVHTSTSETYGTAIYTPIDENHPLQGQSPYSASKIGADKIAESFYLSFNLPVTIIRPFNTYGPRQSARAVIPTIISQILACNHRIKLGSLTPVRDFNFVKDAVEGFIGVAASDNSVGELINVGFGKGISVGELVKTIMLLIGKEVEIICEDDRVRPEKSEVMELICDNQKAAAVVGWQPRFSLEEGLRETIAFIEENLHLYKTDIYNV
jgi:NAD dependent epimerase/dehydratase